MLTQDQRDNLHARLMEMLVGQLRMRWPKAHAYLPTGGARVHCAQPLDEAEQDRFDIFVLSWMMAAERAAQLLNPGSGQIDRPLALVMAENCVFQGGSLPARRGSRPGPEARQRGSGAGGEPRKTGGARPARRSCAAARAGLRRLFEGGGGDDV